MNFDYYAYLAKNQKMPGQMNKRGIGSSLVDERTVTFALAEIDRAEAERKEKAAAPHSAIQNEATEQKKRKEKLKNETRQSYMDQTSKLNVQLPRELGLEPDFASLLSPDWLGLEIAFTLQTPWYSKDDRPFHVLDNPVRKDRVFGVPFMAASSWKGLLRWACRMQEGLYKHLDSHDMQMDGWKEPDWILHLFGNEKSKETNFQSGALAFYPTWFDTIGFEVINPHSRVTKAGKNPIYYEVVPAGTQGVLCLLYAPTPGAAKRDGVVPVDALCNLVDAINTLLPSYGISAKRTAGWGTAIITEWKYRFGDGQPITSDTVEKVKHQLQSHFNQRGGGQ